MTLKNVTGKTLPPGQHLIDVFPRFGVHSSRPTLPLPADPVIAIRGAVTHPFELPLAALAMLPRRELIADFHCVAGWSVTNLRWEGVSFETFYRTMIEPSVAPNTAVTHLVFGGLDGYRVGVSLEDALADDVLIAESLGGRPLDRDHGAPARLVSPHQYGFLSTKHLCRIEVHRSEPRDSYGEDPISQAFQFWFKRHPRARVWEEERHRYLPAWSVRLFGRALTARIAHPGDRGR